MVADLPVIDANIFVRHLRQDHADHSPRASAHFGRIEAGGLVARTNALVLSETVYVLQSVYRMSKSAIAAVLLPLIALPNLKIPRKRQLQRALDLYVRYNVSFVDACLAVLVQRLPLSTVVSFDRNYDRIPGVSRFEP